MGLSAQRAVAGGAHWAGSGELLTPWVFRTQASANLRSTGLRRCGEDYIPGLEQECGV